MKGIQPATAKEPSLCIAREHRTSTRGSVVGTQGSKWGAVGGLSGWVGKGRDTKTFTFRNVYVPRRWASGHAGLSHPRFGTQRVGME